MRQIKYHNTNGTETVDFKTALLKGQAENKGLYMVSRGDIPKFSSEQIEAMRGKPYAEISYQVLSPFLLSEIPEKDLRSLLNDAYDPSKIPTRVQHVTGKTHIMWLTQGPTYSFKDYAARFFGRILNYFLQKDDKRKLVFTATSGDTGGAVADALHKLDRIDNVVFMPKGRVSKRQKRQMTTLKENIYAFEVNGTFDVCQQLAIRLLDDKDLAFELFRDRERFTSANSISVGRLLPQAVYPFYAYSQIAADEPMIPSIPSGNFGDMMGTVMAREMGLPIERIIVALNENTEFSDFLKTGKFEIRKTVDSPSSAMNVSIPNNLARLIDVYGGHFHDGKILTMPDIDTMRQDFFTGSITNPEHYAVIEDVYERFGIILDPHGAVGFGVLEKFLKGKHDRLAVVYETADPGKFPEDIVMALSRSPDVPPRMAEQDDLDERALSIESDPDIVKDSNGNDMQVLSEAQYQEAVRKIKEIYS